MVKRNAGHSLKFELTGWMLMHLGRIKATIKVPAPEDVYSNGCVFITNDNEVFSLKNAQFERFFIDRNLAKV